MLGFWEKFAGSKSIENSQSGLYEKIKSVLPDADENALVEVACIAGLLARVAFVDMKIHEKEKEHIRQVLTDWTEFSEREINAISNMAINEVRELVGKENHLYVHHLKPLLDKTQRFQVLRALFAMAASDGEVDNYESEEIRTIGKGLDLFNQEFLAARAEVADKLKALRG